MQKIASLLLSVLLAPAALAQDVQLKALFGTSAMLEVDGKQRVLRAGQTSPEGVQLVEASAGYALIRVGGRQQRLTLEAPVAARYEQASRAEVRLMPDSRGHYSTSGWVNGRRVNMMVDTGATSIAFNYPTARRLGLNLERAQPIRVSTASGIASAYRLTLDSVTIGGIKLHNVDATVHGGDFPEITLLGNSFLSRVDMQQQRGVLILRARN
ncbi:retropepsin-like aspartic protease family protein [Microbulbifer guangxiensis]|uniref:retropepsin-like aspartic protease family protein n=1 Tax=Microbulbifer guangxiensis TaxID=2904249 RepID=UPI001F01DE1C|nr:TIGR02281 family clan AA aspartic protease [Microbulbifer guangxiensis]